MDTSKRPSPSRHASETPVGTKMIGNDGNMWIVGQDKNGTHRWVLLKNSKAPARRSLPSSVTKGELIMTKSGWEFYKKTLEDGRLVYTISILKETAPNRTDWQTIKNEMYLNTLFKWGRFGSFEKWGQMPSEASVLQKAADILGKYYEGKSEDNVPQQEPAPNTPFTDGDYFIKNTNAVPQSNLWIFQVDSYNNKEVYTTYTLFGNKNEGGVTTFEMQDLLEKFESGLFVFCDEEGNPIERKSNPKKTPQPKATKIFDAQEIADLLLLMHSAAFRSCKIESGSDLYQSDKKQKLYGKFMDNAIATYSKYDLSKLIELEWISVTDFIEEENAHSLNNYLTLRGYLGLEALININNLYTENPKNFLNPANFVLPSESKKEEPKAAPATKEQLETAIRGLKILADKGNKEAIAALKGLNYLLSKK